MKKVCYTCLEIKSVFVDKDTKQLICQDCFRNKFKRGGRRRFTKQIEDPTIGDLKRKFESWKTR